MYNKNIMFAWNESVAMETIWPKWTETQICKVERKCILKFKTMINQV